MKFIFALLLSLFVTSCVVYDEPAYYPPPPGYVYYDGYYGYWNAGVFVRVHPYHYYYPRGHYYYHERHYRR